MANYTSTLLNGSSMILSAQEEALGHIKSFLTPAKGHDHIWILPEMFDIEVSTRGYTQAIVEAFKDLVLVNDQLVNLIPSFGKAPEYVAHGDRYLLFKDFPFMAFDRETRQLVHIPMKEEGKESEIAISQEEQEEVQEENKKLLVGKACRVKNRLENHREIKRLEEVHRFEERQYLLQIKGYLYMLKADEKTVETLTERINSQKERIIDLKKQVKDFEPKLGIKEREIKLQEQDRRIEYLKHLNLLPAGVRKALHQLGTAQLTEVKHLTLEQAQSLSHVDIQQMTTQVDQWKKERLLREMQALPISQLARMQYLKQHLSKALQWCRKPNSDHWCCDFDDGSAALVSTQRCGNDPSYEHLQCTLVFYRDNVVRPHLSRLTQSVETALLDHWA